MISQKDHTEGVNLRHRRAYQQDQEMGQETNSSASIDLTAQQERIAIAKRRAKLVERSIPDWRVNLECCTSLIKYAYLKVREAIFGTPPVPYEEFLPQESPPLTQQQHTRYALLIKSVEEVRNAMYKPRGHAFLATHPG